MTVGDRIKSAREVMGLTQSELGKACGVTKQTVFKYENGIITNIPFAKLDLIAEALHTTAAYLMGWASDPYDYDLDEDSRFAEIPIAQFEALKEQYNDDMAQVWRAWQEMQNDVLNESYQAPPPNPSNIIPLDTARFHRIPILGRISAGLPIYAEEHIEGYTLTDLNGGAEYFALRVSGDSMNAIGINDGYLIIVRRQEEVENGEVAVVMVGDDDATVKRFYRTDSTVTLMPQSTNPTHGPQIYDTHNIPVRVLGKVVKVEFLV